MSEVGEGLKIRGGRFGGFTCLGGYVMPRMSLAEFEEGCFLLYRDDVDAMERYDRWEELEEERGRELGYGESEE